MAWATFVNLFLIIAALLQAQSTRAGDVTVLYTNRQISYRSPVADEWWKEPNICGGGFTYIDLQPSYATYKFEGTAIQAHFLKLNEGCSVYIFIDDILQTPYRGIDTLEPGIKGPDCRFWIFRKTGLAWGNHTINIVNVGNSGDHIAFQKFIYTVPDVPISSTSSSASPSSSAPPQESANSSSDAGMIGGAIGGALGGLVLGLLSCYLILRQRRQPAQPNLGQSNEMDRIHHLAPDGAQASYIAHPWQPDIIASSSLAPNDEIDPMDQAQTTQPPEYSRLPLNSTSPTPPGVFTPQELEIVQSLSQRGDVPGGTIEALIARMLAERGQAPTMPTNNLVAGGQRAALRKRDS